MRYKLWILAEILALLIFGAMIGFVGWNFFCAPPNAEATTCVDWDEICRDLDSLSVIVLEVDSAIVFRDSCLTTVGSDTLPAGPAWICKLLTPGPTGLDSVAVVTIAGNEDQAIAVQLDALPGTAAITIWPDSSQTEEIIEIIRAGVVIVQIDSAGAMILRPFEDVVPLTIWGDSVSTANLFEIISADGDSVWFDNRANLHVDSIWCDWSSYAAAEAETASVLWDNDGCSLADTFVAHGLFPRDSLEGSVGSKATFLACPDSTRGGPWEAGVFWSLFAHPGTQDHCGEIWQSSGGTEATDTLNLAANDTTRTMGVIALRSATSWVSGLLDADDDAQIAGGCEVDGRVHADTLQLDTDIPASPLHGDMRFSAGASACTLWVYSDSTSSWHYWVQDGP